MTYVSHDTLMEAVSMMGEAIDLNEVLVLTPKEAAAIYNELSENLYAQAYRWELARKVIKGGTAGAVADERRFDESATQANKDYEGGWQYPI